MGIWYDLFIAKCTNDSGTEVTNKGLLMDDPIDSIEKESFERKEYAESIVNEIIKTTSKRSFNIAVSGKWGSGKTSFMKLMKVYMEKDEKHFITINYNPWDFKEEKFIDLDLLKAISHGLSNEKELEDSIQKLFNSLQGVNKSPWYKLISFLLPENNKTIQEYRQDIGKILQRKDKKLIIFLDDLDRLEGKEIMEIFKTIRNSFNIANTFFILGFDMDYVSKQIEDILNKSDSIHYMEKIFQMRLNLPSNESYDFNEKLTDLIFENYHYRSQNGLKDIELKNWREVYAIINSLKVFFNNENQHIGDYNLDALILIEWIKLKDPNLYDYMAYNSNKIVTNYLSTNKNSHVVGTSNFGVKKDFNDGINSDKEHKKLVSMFLDYINNYNTDMDSEKAKIEYAKYFKYALLPEEFSKVYLLEAVRERSDEIVNTRLNDFNKRNFLNGIDGLLKNMSNSYPDPALSRVWMMKWQIKLLYENQIGMTNEKERYYLNHFSNFKDIEELNQLTKNLDAIQKLNFTMNCNGIIDSDFIGGLINNVINFFGKDTAKFDIYYEDFNFFIATKKEFIDENLLYQIKENFKSYFRNNVISYIKPYVHETQSNHFRSYDRIQNFELPRLSIFEANDWIDCIKETDDEKLIELKRWLETINNDNSVPSPLDYNLLYGERYTILKNKSAWDDENDNLTN